jgi:ABC-type uncharacterized transport system auxiliary subunit
MSTAAGVRRVGALLLVVAAGCAAFQAAPAARTFRIAYQPPVASTAAPLPVVVRVMPFGIAAPYNREVFVFRTGVYDLGIDYYNRWIASPATMLTDLVARDLAASQTVRAVLQSPSALPTDYELSAQIETFEERDEDNACTAHLRLRALLVRAARDGRSVAMQQDFVVDEPCVRGDVESYVAAMSRATERTSTDVRGALLDAIRSGAAMPIVQ